MFDCYRETTPAPVTSNASVNTSANIRLDVLSNGAPVSNVVIGDMISLRLTLTTDSRKYSLTYLLIYLLTYSSPGLVAGIHHLHIPNCWFESQLSQWRREGGHPTHDSLLSSNKVHLLTGEQTP